MTTDTIRTRLYNKKLLDYLTMDTKLLAWMVSEFRQLHSDAYTKDGVLGGVAITVAPTGNNMVNIAAAMAVDAVSGTGRRFKLASGDSRLQNLKIPPDAAVVYDVGLEQSDVEQGIEINPRTGDPEYLEFKEMLGRVGTPTSVTDNGNGTLTINVNSLCESGKDYSGRTVRVWLKSRTDGGIGPKSPTEAIAIQNITIAYSAPNNTITVPNLMGQTAASTTAADYKVMINGPTVKREGAENLRNTVGCLFLAAVTSVAAAAPIVSCNTTDQNLIGLDLSTTGQASNIQYGGGGAWADGGTNPATTVEAQLDKVISDLAATTGGAKIGGAASGTDIAAANLNVQIANLAVNWAKLARANTFSALQTFNAGIAVPNGQDIVLSGDARVAHGTRTVRHAVHNRAAMFISGASPSNATSISFGTGSTAAGEWAYMLPGWDETWNLIAVRASLPSTIVGAGGKLYISERRAGGTWNDISTYTFVGGESGLVTFTTPGGTSPYALVLRMDLTVGSTTTALVNWVELDYNVQP